MDFKSLGAGQTLYVLQKSDKQKPVLQLGVVKSKSEPKAAYQTNQPLLNGLSAMNGQNVVVDIVASINGNDVPFNNLPANNETASYNGGNTFISCNQQATIQAVDAMMQVSRQELERESYNKSVLSEGEKMLEILNPRYAEEKKRDRSIKVLEERQAATDKKLDTIIDKLNELFTPTKK